MFNRIHQEIKYPIRTETCCPPDPGLSSKFSKNHCMKKWILSAFAFLAIQTYAQDMHNHDANPNLSPYLEAAKYTSGLSKKHLYQQAAWKQFQQNYPDWGASMDYYTGLPHRAFGTPINYAPGGMDPLLKAKLFLQNELGGFQLPLSEFVVTRQLNDGKYIHIDFKQIHAGMEVLWSRTTVRMSQDLKICLFGTDAHRNIPALTPAISESQAIQAAVQTITTTVVNTEVQSALKIFPLPKEGKYDYRPVYAVTVHTQDDKITPGKYLTYVDAINGEILYRQNKVVHVGFDVKADLYPTNLFAPLANLPLKNLLVNVSGTNYYTDLLGNVVVPGAGPVNPTITLSGKFIKIVTGANGTTSPTYSPSNVNNGDIVDFPHSSPNATERHMTCYYHANEIHDHMKMHLPNFTAMDNPLTTRVDRTDGNCNAFYDGSSINFYTTANGCNALSLVSDVMYHEYGHGITNVFWDDQGTSFDNGGMGEGYSDVWAMSITKSPLIGPGFFIGQPNSTIRRYDVNPKIYPQNLVGQVHADGEIIAGAWWDFAQDMISGSVTASEAIDTMARIFSDSHYGLANGPDGQEGQVYHDILIDALQYDDNDANLNNGTPHFLPIVNGFAAHGIYLLSDAELDHNEPGVVNAGSTISLQADATVNFPAFLGDVKMFFREKGTTALDSLLMTKNGNIFTANFPQNAGPKIYEYYFNVYDNANTLSASSPEQARFGISSTQRNLPHFLIIGYKQVYLQDFENALSANWFVGNVAGDNATAAGRWIVAAPVPSTTNGDTVQTGKDHTSGTGKCAVTGNAPSATSTVGNADVDGGRTSLLTDELDLSTYTEPIISYWRWFSNSQGSNPRKDHWRVWGSYDNGTTWFQIERTFQPDVNWRRNIFLPNLTQGNKVRFMFVATDSVQGGGGALVEAAVDDIEVLEVGNTPAGVGGIEQLQSLVFPNPAKSVLQLLIPESGEVQAIFRNTLGQNIYSTTFQNDKTNRHTIPLLQIPNGIYFLQLEVNGKSSVHRIVVSK
jgi:hypothetical protein